MDLWLERIWVGSETEEEGRGLNTGAYWSLTFAMVSRKTTSGEENIDGVKRKIKMRICLVETKGKRSTACLCGTGLAERKCVVCGVKADECFVAQRIIHLTFTTNPSLLMVTAIH